MAAEQATFILNMQPIVQDVDWLDVVMMDGRIWRCTRETNRELFTLVVEGYGLFGIILRERLQSDWYRDMKARFT